jgi:hypothetical protein
MNSFSYLKFQIPSMLLSSSKIDQSVDPSRDIYTLFNEIHENVRSTDWKLSTPRHYIKFLKSFQNIYDTKMNAIVERQKHLKVRITTGFSLFTWAVKCLATVGSKKQSLLFSEFFTPLLSFSSSLSWIEFFGSLCFLIISVFLVGSTSLNLNPN